MSDLITAERVEDGLWRLVDPMGFMAHLVVGSRRAVLVDAMLGIGDVRAAAESLAPGLPVSVALTHRHPDHVGGAYRFDEVMMSAEEDGHWEEAERHAAEHRADGAEGNVLLAAAPWAFDEGARPRVTYVVEGDELDLGGRRLVCVALPGHTVDSVGYLCPELGVLLSGDAVTPIMCLCFEESLPVAAWRATLAKMGGLPFERFYTGHHRHAFTKADLPSFVAAADFAEKDRGLAWHHAAVADWEGTCHLCPCGTADADSPEFRAVITRGLPAPLPRRSSRPRRRARPCAEFGGCVRERCRICRICALAGAHMRLFRRRKRTHPGILARRPHGRGAEKNRAPGAWLASTKPAAECPRELWCAHMVRAGAACEGDSRTRRHASAGEATQGGFA